MQVTRKIFPQYEAHLKKWHGCQGCALSDRVVFAEGSLPCDILFLAKSPDDGAVTHNRPFPRKQDVFYELVPKQGKYLQDVMGIPTYAPTPSWAVCYGMSCRYHTDYDIKASLAACWPKVVELFDMAQPKLVVCLGQIIHGFVITRANSLPYRPPIISVADPDYIERNDDRLGQTIKAQLRIRDAIAKYF